MQFYRCDLCHREVTDKRTQWCVELENVWDGRVVEGYDLCEVCSAKVKQFLENLKPDKE